MNRTYRVVAEFSTGFEVIGICFSRQSANKLADRYMLSLNPDEDECPEMLIEVCR